MSTSFLRIYHNGNVLVKNPYWHLSISTDGKMSGEVLPCLGVRREFHEQLTDAEAQTLFKTADAMSQELPPVEQHVGHCHDNVCVQGSDPRRILYRYIVPPNEQRRESVVEFFRILNRVVEKYAG
jgi:hypothetical protein